MAGRVLPVGLLLRGLQVERDGGLAAGTHNTVQVRTLDRGSAVSWVFDFRPPSLGALFLDGSFSVSVSVSLTLCLCVSVSVFLSVSVSLHPPSGGHPGDLVAR